jgi:hypothetical protein
MMTHVDRLVANADALSAERLDTLSSPTLLVPSFGLTGR